jgi:hypothetical protein
MKKITMIMLFAAFTAVTLNAAPNVSGATSVDDLCGWYYWYNRQAAANPTTNVTGDDLKALYDAGTNKSKYVCFTKVDESTIMIYGMFECPVTATVNLSGSNKYIDIAIDQVTGYYKGYGNIVLGQRTWLPSANEGAGGYVTYPTVRMYLNGSIIYISNNWIQQSIKTPTATYAYEKWVIPGFWQNPETQKYTFFNYFEAARNTTSIPYADWNAVMYTTYGDKGIHNWPYESKAVNVTQVGNTLQVENFLGNGQTVNIDLHADNTLSIENQLVRTPDYIVYPATGNVADMENPIYGTGTEEEVTWGNFCYSNGTTTYYFNDSKIVFLNKDVNKFHFPVALTISDAGIASFSSQKNADFSQVTKLGDTPETVALTPYAVTDFNAQRAQLTAVTTAIPADNGVFVKGDAGSYEVPTVAEADPLTVENKLKATSSESRDGDGSTVYALGMQDGKAGLMLVTAGTTIAENKAYLVLENPTTEAKSFVPFSFGDDTPTSINGVEAPANEAAPMYNLQGQRVGQNYRGIVVKNGKKSIIR